MSGLLGAVLAGGASRRFGSPKALAKLHGRPLWQVAAERLRRVCGDVVAVVGDPAEAALIGLETLPDRAGSEGRGGASAGVAGASASAGCAGASAGAAGAPRRLGPVAGIDAALARARRGGLDAVLVLAVDMPWARTGGLRRLAEGWREHGRAVVARAGPPWGFHPLCAVYPVGALEAAGRALRDGVLEAGAFARSLDPVVIDAGLSPEDLRSVNRAADLPPPAFSIIGNKKSGKTTLCVGVIAELARRGRGVMSVKHGHRFRVDARGTDSWRHRHEGGAGRVLLAGPDEFAVMGEWGRGGMPSLDRLLARHLGGAEIVVVEGFRGEAVPKVEIFRRGAQPEGVVPAGEMRRRGVMAVVTDSPGPEWRVPVIDADAPDAAARVADVAEARLL